MKKMSTIAWLDWIHFLVIVPALIIFCFYILFGSIVFQEPATALKGLLVTIPFSILRWGVNNHIMVTIKNHFPGLRHTVSRIILVFLVQFIVMAVIVFFIMQTWEWIHLFSFVFSWDDYRWLMLILLAYALIRVAVIEADYIYLKYKESLSEKELIEKMTLEQEIEVLKNQINPHFLFNCFNTLSSLITVDKKEAENFLDELSKVYRYLLNSNQNGFSTLESEIKFIESYSRLLKTRYREGLRISVNVDKHFYSYNIPSFSLQLLVENAVKHNIVSSQQPLILEIFTATGNKLVVNNNLQRKQLKEKSTRIGIQNIKSKYQLIKEKGFQVVEGERNFMVVLPMLRNEICS